MGGGSWIMRRLFSTVDLTQNLLFLDMHRNDVWVFSLAIQYYSKNANEECKNVGLKYRLFFDNFPQIHVLKSPLVCSSNRLHLKSPQNIRHVMRHSMESQERRLCLSGHCMGHPEEETLKLVLWQPPCSEVIVVVR